MKKLNGESLNITEENLKALEQLFPEAFEEGKIDFAVLKQLLGDFVDDEEERYSFKWNGKGRALRLSQTPSLGTLRPCKKESKDWDTTENLYIEGDNLEVLKLLQKSYYGKVKMIYIDPPYNTGGDFVYKDDFKDNVENYKRVTGQVDGEGHKIDTNTESNGRFHTDWLNMMYPRLKLARNLLSEDGVIFISIDDNEQGNLRHVCDEVFGQINFINNVIWQKKYSPQNDAQWFSDNHDFVLIYAKNKTNWHPHLLPRTEEMNARYKNPDNDSKGPWKLITLHAKSGNNTNFSYTFKNGVTWRPPSGTYPRFSVETMKKYDEEGKIWFGADGKSVPSVKNYLSDVKQGVTPLTIWTYEEVGHNQTAREDVKKCFDGKNPFDTPKPVSLIRQICYVASSSKDCIILDFFSGSSTTAHAVMQLNAEDGGNRKFIMVQLPEPTADNSEAAKAGYKNICEIGKERIRRAGEKIKAECEDKDKAQNLDIGFKVFKLDSSNLKKWNPHPEDLQLSLQESVSNFLPGRSQLDVVYEILLKMGLDLTSPIEERKAGNETVYIIAGGALMICLGEKITLPVAEEIAKLHKEYDSELWQVVFRDTGFASDMDKTNIKETLKTAGLDEDSFVCV
ncbi:MAG: site-specific DNA-methyltransferase [Selenomonadaceae bacterium]|nr:site-specific DNA-methyltransferase [Selenomonadaceae bacterium]